MIALTELTINYAIFALITTSANNDAQDLINSNYSGAPYIMLKEPL